MSLCEAGNSQLVVIDVQERLAAAMPEPELTAMTQACGRLLQAATILAIPIVYTEQYPRGLGRTVDVVARHLPAATESIEKTCFSCAGAAEFRRTVERNERRQIVLAGMEAHVCVLQTAFDMHAAGSEVFVVADAVCSRRQSHYHNALQRLSHAGITVSNTESVLFEWLRDAGHEHFRTVSALLK